MSIQRLVSGIQPSGPLAIGHYLGALKSWQSLAATYDCFFGVMDLHAITVDQEPALLRQRVRDTLAWYLACGLDPEQHVMFCQSDVPEHGHLAWILGCVTHMGELSRMTQYKDKSSQQTQAVGSGLFTYPVLMAADILIYQAHRVPVGDDQKQHLELTRDVAMRFNSRYGDCFLIPEPHIPEQGARVMSLQDPTRKMSKSDPNQNGCLLLSDSPQAITKKCKRAVTDSEGVVSYEPDRRPGISNLVALMSLFSGQSIEAVVAAYEGRGYGHLKIELADCIIATLAPLQARFEALQRDPSYLEQVFQKGAERARSVAQQTLRQVHEHMGLGIH